jgi:Ethylbenzene dehydrogenase
MKRLTNISLLFPAVILAMAAFLAVGCEDPGSYGEPESYINGRVVAFRSSVEPPMDDLRADIWRQAITGLIFASDSAFVADSLMDSLPVSIKIIKTDENLYVRADWGENVQVLRRTRSIWPNPIVHFLTTDSISNDTTTNLWFRRKSFDAADTIWNDQDRLAVMWNAGNNGAEGADCRSMCHAPADTTPSGNRHYTTGGGYVDVWHWQAATTDPAFLAQDEYWGSSGRATDAGAQPIFTVNFDTLIQQPLMMNRDSTQVHKPFLHETDAVTFDSSRTWHDKDSIPGYIIHDNASGSVADVAAFSNFSLANGHWTVLMRRALSTGNADDVDLGAIASGDSIMVTIAFMNNADSRHYGSRPFYIIFP